MKMAATTSQKHNNQQNKNPKNRNKQQEKQTQMLTKKTLMETAAKVANKAPHATNSTLMLVDRRHPRGLAGRTLRAAGLTPAQIAEIQHGNTDTYLNEAALRYITTLNQTATTTTWSKAVKALNKR